MSKEVEVPYGDSAAETATLLLAAAEEKGLDPSVVRSGSFGTFRVPEEVAKAAKVDTVSDDEEPAKPAKKTAAKKTAKKK